MLPVRRNECALLWVLEDMKLNLGCGTQSPDGWTNVDYAFGARLAGIPVLGGIVRRLGLFNSNWNPDIVLHDLRRPFPWDNETANAIYSSHTLEHLIKNHGLQFLKECHRVLKQDGILRVVVPDLAYIVSRYTSGATRADQFVEELGVLTSGSDRGIKGRLSTLISFPHKCMYDTKTLHSLLEETGFSTEAKEGLESDIEGIDRIEIPSRTVNAVIVEGRKKGITPFKNSSLQ